MIRGIHHIGVSVRDFDRMVKFYTEAFGFVPASDDFTWEESKEIDEIIGVPGSAARNIMLRAGNAYVELFQFSAPDPQSETPLNPFDRGYTHFCVDVTDVDEEVERLRGLGMTFERDHGRARPVDVGIVKTVYGRDPEGNLIEIQQTAADCSFNAVNLPKTDMAIADM